MLYPIKFEPILKERIWGGSYLCNELEKGTNPDAKIGESWEMSTLEGDVSIVANGFLKGNNLAEIIEVYMGDLLGEKVYEKYGIELPVLIKFLAAEEDLSVQVHPNEGFAKEHYQAHGKAEMWYVLKSEPEARLIAGLDRDCTKEEIQKSIADATLETLLRQENPVEGDVYCLPEGRVHSLGAGNVVVEIQKSSDVTFRIYDYNRPDFEGNLRELHVEESLEVISLKAEDDYRQAYSPVINEPSSIIKTPDFSTNILSFNKKLGRDYYFLDSFVVLVCTEGEFEIEYEGGESVVLKKGETVLLPAQIQECFFVPKTNEATFLETYIEIE